MLSADEQQAFADSLLVLGLSTRRILIVLPYAPQTGISILHFQDSVALVKEAWICLLAGNPESLLLLFRRCQSDGLHNLSCIWETCLLHDC